jgi:hypothetical protein
MAKIDLADVAQLNTGGPLVANVLNANNAKIVAAMERTLSRDGTAPNDMQVDLDLNGHTIYSVRVRPSDRHNAPHGGYINEPYHR